MNELITNRLLQVRFTSSEFSFIFGKTGWEMMKDALISVRVNESPEQGGRLKSGSKPEETSYLEVN